MGAIEQRKEECRDARGLRSSTAFVRTSGMRCARSGSPPGFAGVAILSLALGIGANTAIFSLWNGLLLASLPGVKARAAGHALQPRRLGQLDRRWEPTDGPRSWLTYGEFEQMRDHAEAFSAVMASQSSLGTWQVRFEGSEWEEAMDGLLVSSGFFQVLGVRPAIGRLFTPAEDRTETPHAVLSHSLLAAALRRPTRRARQGAHDPQGHIDRRRCDAARGFIGETAGQQPDLWLPVTDATRPDTRPRSPARYAPQKSMWLHLFARLKPGVTTLKPKLSPTRSSTPGWSPSMVRPWRQLNAGANFSINVFVHSFRRAGASPTRSGILQLTDRAPGGRRRAPSDRLREHRQSSARARRGAQAGNRTADVARREPRARHSAARHREPGAGGDGRGGRRRGRLRAPPGLVRMIVESDEDFFMTFALDPVMLLFLVGTTVVAALLFGLFPAWQVTRTDPGASLKEQSRGAGWHTHPDALGRLLVSLQLALSLPLLVGAGLMARTVYNLQRADVGFAAERLLLVRVDLRSLAMRPRAARACCGSSSRRSARSQACVRRVFPSSVSSAAGTRWRRSTSRVTRPEET